MRYEFTMHRASNPPSSRRGQPDLAAQFEVVHDTIQQATRVASARLTKLGVRHALVGGMAVGAYARPRATNDVDFLVGPEAWPTEGLIVSPIEGLPVAVGRVRVDTLLAPSEAPSIEEAVDRTIESEQIPVAPPEVIVLMKLIAPRLQDKADLDAMLGVVDLEVARAYVAMHAPAYSDDLEAAIREHERQKNLGKRISNP